MMHRSPLLSSMAASVDRERHREAEMRRRSRLVSPHGEQVNGMRSRVLDMASMPRSISIVSFMFKVRAAFVQSGGIGLTVRQRSRQARRPGVPQADRTVNANSVATAQL
jgi:predicted oxidoreductase